MSAKPTDADLVAALVKALECLVFYVEWHMPYKGDQHPTYSKPMAEAYSVLKLARQP